MYLNRAEAKLKDDRDIVQLIRMGQVAEEMYEILFNNKDRAMMLFQKRGVIQTSSSSEGYENASTHLSRAVFDELNKGKRDLFKNSLREILENYEGRELKSKERKVLYGVTQTTMRLAEIKEETKAHRANFMNQKGEFKKELEVVRQGR